MLNRIEMEVFFLTGWRLSFVCQSIRFRIADWWHGPDEG